MKRVEYLQMIAAIFRFKTISDEKGNEYVLFARSALSSVENVHDRTAFEACENHVHLYNNLKKKEFHACLQAGNDLARSLLDSLRYHYPHKQFIVFVSLRLNDSMIIRFHQKWENEEPYYDPNDFGTAQDMVIKLET